MEYYIDRSVKVNQLIKSVCRAALHNHSSHTTELNIFPTNSDHVCRHLYRGISSVVRRCIDKETGKEYAAKIIDLGASDANDPKQMLDATRQEISILRQVMGHPYISELNLYK